MPGYHQILGGSRLILTSGLKFLPLNRIDGEADGEIIEIPKPAVTEKQPQPEILAPFRILTGSVSHDGKLFALCDDHKQLTVWTTSDWRLQSSRILNRRATTAKFIRDDSQILIADKTGDVYACDVIMNENDKQGGKLILGHLSMLLDLVITPDDKYVITADRDEKIRVSNYPDAYDIHGFCLGHTDFVTDVHLASSDGILVSGGGDGTVKLWRYLDGRQVFSVTASNEISNQVSGESSGVVKMRLFSYDDGLADVLVVQIEGYNGLLIFKITKSNEIKFSDKLPFDVVRDFNFDGDGVLWVFTNRLKTYAFDGKTFHEKENKTNTDKIKEFIGDILSNPLNDYEEYKNELWTTWPTI